MQQARRRHARGDAARSATLAKGRKNFDPPPGARVTWRAQNQLAFEGRALAYLKLQQRRAAHCTSSAADVTCAGLTTLPPMWTRPPS